MHYSEQAFAKLNLFLEITGKRPDGYHTLSSIMQTVSLHDDIEMDVNPSNENNIQITCDRLPADETNLAYRAASAFLNASGIKADVRIHLSKRIPIAAGLGGGSADAAAVLRVLMKEFPMGLSGDELLRVATKLGADVPFCYKLGTCLCEGIGEIMMPIENRWNGYYVVSRGSSQVSTPAAYRAIDEHSKEHVQENPQKLMGQLNQEGAGPLTLFNRFEEVIEPLHEDITQIKTWMLESGAKSVLMSGSGPSVFGLFDSKNEAQKATDIIMAHGWFAEVCQNQFER